MKTPNYRYQVSLDGDLKDYFKLWVDAYDYALDLKSKNIDSKIEVYDHMAKSGYLCLWEIGKKSGEFESTSFKN